MVILPASDELELERDASVLGFEAGRDCRGSVDGEATWLFCLKCFIESFGFI